MQPDPASRQQLGRYELRSVLGKGGSGVVYEAVMHGLAGFRKPVALKVLAPRPDLDDASARAALQREARLGALLSHPNLVSILDLGRSGTQWYIAMELVAGLPVSALVRARPLTPAMVLDIGLMAAAGLAHLHDLRVDGAPGRLVHRDIKPQNLLVDENGVVKIADFGIAALVSEQRGAAGTPTWMAPEQQLGPADPRSDLFSLGAVLFALVTRKAPFGTGARALVEVQRCEDYLAEPRFFEPIEASVPGLGEVLRRCLRLDPADRWPDAHALAAALRVLRPAHGPPTLAEAVAEGRGAAPRTGPPTVGATATRSRLPEVDPLFVGRATETRRLAELLRDHRAVTVVGPGGVGKSRLALEVAGQRVEHALFAELSAHRAPGDLARAVAERLGLRSLDHDEVGQVGAALSSRGPLLVVLDGAEGAAESVGQLVQQWLEAAPEARFLVTSRVPLRHRTERVLVVEPLATDDATTLYVARSLAPLHDEDRGPIAELVRALDGLPLAIELAAARSRSMTPRMLLERMSERFRLLADPRRGGPGRHATLKASIQVSWELLRPWEQSALTQLSVFAGGWTLEAAEAVLDLEAWPEAPWAVDVSTTLADASLLHFDAARQRFHLSNSVREFARDAGARQTLDEAEERHGEWFAQLGSFETLDRAISLGGESVRDAAAAERENLLVACERALARADAWVASGCACAAGELFRDHGPVAPGEELLSRVLELDHLPHRARLLLQRYSLRGSLGRDADARRDLEEANLIARRERGVATELAARAFLLREDPDRPAAAVALGALAEEARARGEPRAEARARTIRGLRLHGLGDHAGALAEQERALALYEELGDARGSGLALLRLGRLDLEAHRHSQGLLHLEEAERRFHAARDQHNAYTARENIAVALYWAGRRQESRQILLELVERTRRYGDRSAEANLRSNLAQLEREAGHPDETRVHLRRALQLLRDAQPTETLARTLDEAASLEELVGDLERSARFRREAGAAWTSMGQASEAASCELRAALTDDQRLSPGEPDVLEATVLPKIRGLRRVEGARLLGEARLRSGDLPGAARLLADARAARRDRGEDLGLEAELRILEARLCSRGGRHEDALELLIRAEPDLKEERVRGALWLARAEVLLSAGDPALARRALGGAEAALQRAGAGPTSVPVRDLLALRARVDATLARD